MSHVSPGASLASYTKMKQFLPVYTCLIILSIHLKISTASTEKFSEELYIKPLPSGHVYSYFQFTTQWDVDPQVDKRNFTHVVIATRFIAWLFCLVNHFNRFPRSIGEIISAHLVRELHLSLTQGLWRTHKWGYPARHAGPGAEVSASFPSHLTRYSLNFKLNL